MCLIYFVVFERNLILRDDLRIFIELIFYFTLIHKLNKIYYNCYEYIFKYDTYY